MFHTFLEFHVEKFAILRIIIFLLEYHLLFYFVIKNYYQNNSFITRGNEKWEKKSSTNSKESNQIQREKTHEKRGRRIYLKNVFTYMFSYLCGYYIVE